MRSNFAYRILFCLSLIVMFASQSLAARGMWGSKRKRDDEENVDDISGGVNSGFESKREMAAPRKTVKQAATVTGFDAMTGADGSLGETIEGMLNMYLTMMEELVESPDFENLVTPEAVTAIFDQVPELSNHPQVMEMLNSPALQDPALLKATILQGMQAIRGYTSEIVDFFSSPEKIRQVIEQLPEEIRAPLNAIMQGDTSAIKDILKNIPGLGADQQDILMNLLDGNMVAITSTAKKLMSDPDQTEAARQQFLQNPGMAEMFGISEDVINDKKQFEALMAQGMDSLLAGGGDDDEYEVDGSRGGRQ